MVVPQAGTGEVALWRCSVLRTQSCCARALDWGMYMVLWSKERVRELLEEARVKVGREAFHT